jgi:hypothetical protein
VSQAKKFFAGPKSQTVLYVYGPIVFKFFRCLVGEKIEIKVFACLKTLINFEDPYRNPLQNACCGI